MAFWNRDDEGEWEQYQKFRGKEQPEPREDEGPSTADEFRAYFKTVRQAQIPASGEPQQPGEEKSPIQTFLSRLRDEKPEEMEPETPPENQENVYEETEKGE